VFEKLPKKTKAELGEKTKSKASKRR